MIWRLTSVALFGLASITGPVAAVVAGTVGAGLLAFSYIRPNIGVDAPLTRIVSTMLVLALVGIGSQLGSYRYPQPAETVSALWLTGIVAAAVMIAWPREHLRRLGPAVGLVLIATLAIGTVLQYQGNLFGLDVYRSHEAAADALAFGQNPYTDAVRVLDGSPNAEDGAVIEGYAYPPVTLVPFAFGDWIGGDPRWASVIAVVGGLLLLIRQVGVVGVARTVVVLLAATPTLRWIVWSGATEPLSFALLVIAAVTWRRWLLSAVFLGLALGTKQYLAMLAPLVFLFDERPWRRAWMATLTAGATLLPALIADPEAFWRTLVERPLSRLDFRADTQSVSGAMAQLGWRVEIPTVVMVLTVVGVVVLLHRTIPERTPSAFLAASAIVLSAMFLTSLAFTNYWWLVQWLAAAATLLAVRDRVAGEECSVNLPGAA